MRSVAVWPICSVAVLALLPTMPLAAAADRVLNDAALAAALDVYADGVVEEHAIEIACGAAADSNQWTQGAREFTATLWSNGVAASLVHDIEHRLAAPPPTGIAAECSDPKVTARADGIRNNGWPSFHRNMAEGIGLVPVAAAPTEAQLAAVRAVFAGEGQYEARLLACIAVTDASTFPFLVSDWTASVVEAGKTMVVAGFPRDEAVALVDSVDPMKIWRKASGSEADDLRTSCTADATWTDRYYQMEIDTLQFQVEKILKPAG